MSNIIIKMWELSTLILKQVNSLWEFLNTKWGFTILSYEVGFVPLDIISYSLITLIGLWLIKSLIPMS